MQPRNQFRGCIDHDPGPAGIPHTVATGFDPVANPPCERSLPLKSPSAPPSPAVRTRARPMRSAVGAEAPPAPCFSARLPLPKKVTTGNESRGASRTTQIL